MNCQRAREVFPELLDSRTAAVAHLDARAHLANCPDCQREFVALTQTAAALDAMPTPNPSPRLRKNFYSMLEEEKHSAEGVRVIAERRHRVQLWRWFLFPLAGCALVALGFIAGARRAAPTVVREAGPTAETLAMQNDIKKLRDDVKTMSTLVAHTILQQQQNPANERLVDVLTKAKSDNVTDKVLSDLLLALTLDPNANVRLRALEALYRHAERDVVRAGVLAALPREQNPLVQVELIDFVAGAQVPDASPVLEKIAADESANESVRTAAKYALAQL